VYDRIYPWVGFAFWMVAGVVPGAWGQALGDEPGCPRADGPR
jgi:hypothetical protein